MLGNEMERISQDKHYRDDEGNVVTVLCLARKENTIKDVLVVYRSRRPYGDTPIWVSEYRIFKDKYKEVKDERVVNNHVGD